MGSKCSAGPIDWLAPVLRLGPLLAWLPLGAAGAATPPTLAIMPFELIDTSLEGEMDGTRPDQTARLALIQAELTRLLAETGRYQIMAVPADDPGLRVAGSLHGCNGCEAGVARKLGADQVLIGWVQKVSNLILNLNVGIRDATSRSQLFAASVDIRGNTDASWLHGIRYLVKRRLLQDNSKLVR